MDIICGLFRLILFHLAYYFLPSATLISPSHWVYDLRASSKPHFLFLILWGHFLFGWFYWRPCTLLRSCQRQSSLPFRNLWDQSFRFVNRDRWLWILPFVALISHSHLYFCLEYYAETGCASAYFQYLLNYSYGRLSLSHPFYFLFSIWLFPSFSWFVFIVVLCPSDRC